MSKRKYIKILIMSLALCLSTFSFYNANAMEFKQIEIETPKEKKENKEKKEKKKYGFDYTKLNKIINEEDKKAKQRFLLEVEDIYKKFKDNEYELMAHITDAYLKSDLFKYVIQTYKILLLTALDQYERCGFIDYDITNEIRIKKKYLLNIRCLDNKNKLNKEKFIDIIGDFIKSKIGIDLNKIDVTIPEPSEEKLEKYFNKYEQDKIDLSNEFKIKYDEITKKFGKDNENIKTITPKIIKQFKKKLSTNIQDVRHKMIQYLEQKSNEKYVNEEFIDNITKYNKNMFLDFISLTENNELDKNKFIETLKKFEIIDNNSKYIINKEEELKLLIFLRKYKTKIEKENLKETTIELLKTSPILQKTLGSIINSPKEITKDIIEQFKNKLSETISKCHKRIVKFLEEEVNKGSSINRYYIGQNYIEYITNYIPLTENNELDKNKFIETLKKFEIIDNNSKYIINKEEELNLLIFLRKYKTKIEKENLKETTIELLKTSPILKKALNSTVNNSQEKNIQAGNEIPSNVILDENNKVEDKIINEKKAIADGIITRNNLNLLKKEVKKIYPCKNNSKNLKVKINYEIQNKKNKKENLDEPNKNIIKNNSNLPKKEIEKNKPDIKKSNEPIIETNEQILEILNENYKSENKENKENKKNKRKIQKKYDKNVIKNKLDSSKKEIEKNKSDIKKSNEPIIETIDEFALFNEFAAPMPINTKQNSINENKIEENNLLYDKPNLNNIENENEEENKIEIKEDEKISVFDRIIEKIKGKEIKNEVIGTKQHKFKKNKYK